MSIRVKFFASLREQLRRGGEELEATAGLTVQGVWDTVCAGAPLADNVLAAVNYEYVGRDHPVSDGDEVAFFPPVTGGGS